MTQRERSSHDHRIKAQTAAAGDPNLFPELEIPRSTTMSWIRRGVGEVVSALRVLGLSAGRYHDWVSREEDCSMATLRKLVEFYVVEHNTAMPHSAFDEQTPDEMYFGRGEVVPDELAKKRREARTRRVQENRKMACSNCPRGSAIVSEDKAA